MLDLSKLAMRDFHYEEIRKQIKGQYHLIYSDTDSLVYSIQRDDIDEWIKQNQHHLDVLDWLRLYLNDNSNTKVLG